MRVLKNLTKKHPDLPFPDAIPVEIQFEFIYAFVI